MKGVGIVRETVAACAALAALAVITGVLLGRAGLGIGFAAGLIIGSMNGELLRRGVERSAPFVASSVLRMAVVSAVAILAAVLAGGSLVAILLGVAGAQVVMVAVSVREGLRA